MYLTRYVKYIEREHFVFPTSSLSIPYLPRPTYKGRYTQEMFHCSHVHCMSTNPDAAI